MNTSRQEEYPSDYPLDPGYAPEWVRLRLQERFVNDTMGYLLPPEVEKDARQKTVLDLACGPGGWVLDVAYDHPAYEVMGVDIVEHTIQQARASARSQGRDNASFEVMDIRQPLEFNKGSFDIVNMRFVCAAIPRDLWGSVLREIRRILRPGGWIVLTDGIQFETTSAATNKLIRLISAMIQKRGLSFSPDGVQLGILPVLETLVRAAGFTAIDRQAHLLNISSWSDAHILYKDDLSIMFRIIKERILELGLVSEEEYEGLLHTSEIDAYDEKFSGIGTFLTVWGQNTVV